jgi:hypothetical protein
MNVSTHPALPEERWAEVVQFYRRLSEDHARQEPMLQFVEWFASTKYSEVLYPVTSMATLVISILATFPDRLQRPQVFVAYSREREQFLVTWHTPSGAKNIEEWVESPSAPEVLSRMLAWLEVPAGYDSRFSPL